MGLDIIGYRREELVMYKLIEEIMFDFVIDAPYRIEIDPTLFLKSFIVYYSISGEYGQV